MRRWSSVAGVVLIVLGVLAIFRIGWIFWPLLLIGVGVWFIMGFSRGGFSRSGFSRGGPGS
ncbi:MAG TPA: hypothetical protein VFB30_02355, partial [Spirochaetia bacterium]|nr:hypothetical protein [Spirochaetia bacterium]